MAITRKTALVSTDTPKDSELEQFIEAGGGTAKAAKKALGAADKPLMFTMRIPADVAAEVDELRKSGRVSVPRVRWVLEAILMRIEKEKEG